MRTMGILETTDSMTLFRYQSWRRKQLKKLLKLHDSRPNCLQMREKPCEKNYNKCAATLSHTAVGNQCCCGALIHVQAMSQSSTCCAEQ